MNGLTLIHIAGGSVALIAGAGGLAFRKGGRMHALAGTWFFAAMLVLAGTGAVMAALKPERGTALIGIFTCYLVATSWATARRRSGEAGRFEVFGLAVAAGCAIALLSLGLLALASANGRVDSLPAAVHFPFAAIAALATVFDIAYLRRGQLSGRQRIARHLWRMCTALLIAAFSFFLGQQKVMPEAIQGSPFLFVPPLATLGLMAFWIFRVRLSKRFAGYVTRKGGRGAEVAVPEVLATAG